MIGEVWLSANDVNSRAMQTLAICCNPYAFDGSLPGVPTSDGMITVKPRSTTSFANLVTSGVMPGISWITITPGPSPRR